MANNEIKVLILGGSGHLGSSIFRRLNTTKGIKVVGTYYENKPRWAEDGSFYYLNGNTPEIDDDFLKVIDDSDVVLNLIKPRRTDFNDSVLFDTPLKIAEIISKKGGRFLTLCGSINMQGRETPYSKSTERLANVLVERDIGSSVQLPMIIDKNSRAIEVIFALSKYKITPIIGDGSHKVRALHVTDFISIITKMIQVHLPNEKYYLTGSEAMTLRHLFNVACQENKSPKPIFLSINRNMFEKYRTSIGELFGIKLSLSDIFLLDFKEEIEGADLCKSLKVKPLSFDARVKRDGL